MHEVCEPGGCDGGAPIVRIQREERLETRQLRPDNPPTPDTAPEATILPQNTPLETGGIAVNFNSEPIATQIGMIISGVRDVEVVESTHSVVERAAIQAALKFKYKPRVADGVPVESTGVIHYIRFEFDE